MCGFRLPGADSVDAAGTTIVSTFGRKRMRGGDLRDVRRAKFERQLRCQVVHCRRGLATFEKKQEEKKNSECSPAALLAWSVHNMKNQ